jgi:hypothetical protein
MTRDNIMSLLPPDKNAAECFEGQCLVDIGRNIGADYAAQGTVSRFGQMLTLSVECYETRGGGLIGSFTTESFNANGLLIAMRKNAAEVFARVKGFKPVKAAPAPPAPPPPQYGWLILKMPKGWQAGIDGKPAILGENRLSVGTHQVTLTHSCYKTLNFAVTTIGGKRDTLSPTSTLKTGNLLLQAQALGQPMTEPVWVDGKQVGSTPWRGDVSVCAVVQVGKDRKMVGVALQEGKSVTYTQEVEEPEPEPEIALEAEPIPQAPVSIDPQVAYGHHVVGGILDAVGAGLLIAGLYQNSVSLDEHEAYMAATSQDQMDLHRNNSENARSSRNILYGIGFAALAGGLVVHLAF